MAKVRLLGAVVLLLSLLFPVHSQIKAGDWAISPWLQNMRVGETSRLQILDERWQELEGAEWSVDDESLAGVDQDPQRKSVAVVRALAPGEVTVRAILDGQTHSITINIWPAQSPPSNFVSWDSSPFGKTINYLKARETVGDGPYMYIASVAGALAVLHAVAHDGLQYWNWTIPESQGNTARLLCGSDDGGVIVKVQRSRDYVLYRLSASGELQWTYFGHDKLESHALGHDETLYLLEAGPGHFRARLVVVDGDDGKEKFSKQLPQSITTRTNVAVDAFVCTPGVQMRVPQLTALTHLMVNTDGNAYLAFTVASGDLQAVNCTPQTGFHPVDVRTHYDNSIFLWQISPQGAIATTLVQRDQGEVGPRDLAQNTLLTGDLIPDGEGGVLIAIRKALIRPAGSLVAAHDYVYRVAEEKLIYQLALPDSAGLRAEDGMVLNDENHAWTSVDGLLLCFDSITGKELWRYDTHTPRVHIVFAAADGGIVVEDSNYHMLALDKNGTKKADEDFDPAHRAAAKLPE